MSTFPEPTPDSPEDTSGSKPAEPQSIDPFAEENLPAPPGEWVLEPEETTAEAADTSLFQGPAVDETSQPPMFASLEHPAFPREERIPNLGHLGLLVLLGIFGWLGAGMLVFLALRVHLWGISNLTQAASDFRYTLASEAVQYVITFAGALAVFPIVWRKPFFDGIHWNGKAATQRAARLASAAIACFFVAILNGLLMPGPTNAPIDELFKAPGAAWVLFAFGITLAPFFEELAFRGFLLPSLCTAWDWSMEHFTGAPRRPVDEDGNPQWSLLAMIIASVLTSVPFALLHGAQTSWSLGPFLLLIFVSLVLCWVRLSTRSLAASTMVHSFYNLMLFSFMLLGTGGFKHLDRL
jgi:uncharacterized protein